jgi:mannitol/fructose-specific phosphotransferase system IIA component (Ntr-type)
MNHWKNFKPKSCSVNLKATDKDSALREIVEQLQKAGMLPEDQGEQAVKALFEREKLASTGVGMGVAIPHVKLKGLDRVVCSLSVHHEGLEWAAVDGEPVHIFFTVLRPEREGEHYNESDHIEMMSWIAGLSRTPDFRRFATQAKTKTELVDLLKEMSAV